MLLFNRNMQRSHRSSSHACKHSNTKGVNVIICLERAVASGFAVLVYTIAVDNSSDVARDAGEAEESGGLNVLVDAVPLFHFPRGWSAVPSPYSSRNSRDFRSD